MNGQPLYERYERQLQLTEFGIAGQQKLSLAKILVVGAGGLGCPALQYLAAAGVGTIGVIDHDIVSLNNLHRQPIYTTKDIGTSKAHCAAARLLQLNPEINVIGIAERLTNANAFEVLAAYDLIIDGSDNFATRYLVNDACVLLNKPFIYGAVSKYEGQVAVFNKGAGAVNYRDLFPVPPKDNEVLNCAQAGVLGVLPGIIGTMQASEAIKLITGIGTPLINHLVNFNVLTNQLFHLKLIAKPETRSLIPADRKAFESQDYDWLCASDFSSLEIDASQFNELIDAPHTLIIDVREKDELPVVAEFRHVQAPLKRLGEQVFDEGVDTIVVFCQSGKRSLSAANYLKNAASGNRNIYSLKGGIAAWKQFQENRKSV